MEQENMEKNISKFSLIWETEKSQSIHRQGRKKENRFALWSARVGNQGGGRIVSGCFCTYWWKTCG